MPDNTILDQIRHYQKDIIKCPDNSKRMMRCIERLMVLPITIKHLQETGVGRSVNELRKCGGEVGAAANSLVCKWKSMVKDEVEESSEESEVEIKEVSEEPKKDFKSDSKYIPTKIEISQKEEQNHTSEQRKSSHKKTESSNNDSRSSKNIDKKSSSKYDSSLHRDKTSKSSHSSSSHSKSESSHRSRHDSDSRSPKKSHSIRTSESERNGDIKNDKLYSKSTHVHSKSSSSDNKSRDSRQRSDVDKHSRKDDGSQRYKKYDVNRSDSESSDDTVYKPSKKRRTDSEDEEKYHPHKSKSKTSRNKSPEKRDYDSSEQSNNSESEEENDNSVEGDASHNNSPSENGDSSRSSVEDNSSNGHESRGRSSAEESEHEKNDSSQSSDSEENVESSNSEEYVPVKIKQEKKDTPRDNKSHNHSKSSKQAHVNSRDSSYKHSSNSKDIKIKKERHEEVTIKKEKDENDNANKKRPKEDKCSSDKKSHKPSSSNHENKETKKHDKKVKIKIEKGEDGSIGCESGASFGDALLGLSDTKKKAVKRKPPTPLDKPAKPVGKISPKPKYTIKEEPHSSHKSSNEPILLSKNIKLEPLDVDLKSTLPEISPNYKPLPHYSPPVSPAYKRTKLLSQEDALSTIMSTKNQRTKVYSGNKSGYTKVPSLFELCTQVLRDNIDALEYTGGVPYDLLKPVLDRATADQLFQLEHHNPYLIEDTDGLWKFHCNKDFRGKKPDEFETWRELYLRLLDEREKKLVALKANITQSMAKSTPIRQTKLAYVDAVVKPPRNVARQQMKHGTAKAVKHELVSKAMVGAASSSPAPEAVSVPAPPVSSRASNAFPIPNFLKKKKAPLMAKALQLIKGNRFKR